MDAIDDGHYLNDQIVTLQLGQQQAELGGAASGAGTIRACASPRLPTFAAVSGGMLLTELPAGRYAPEFDAIGNDHVAMADLAQRNGLQKS